MSVLVVVVLEKLYLNYVWLIKLKANKNDSSRMSKYV